MVVNILKYIGPFLRMNVLSKENIKNQLFFFSKEAIKNIVLYSGCGMTFSLKDSQTKNNPTNDINTFKGISPLQCVYKKADTKLINADDKLIWNEEKFKKEVCPGANALMTLSILELSDYYNSCKNSESLRNLGNIYVKIAKKQLDFYASYLRNEEGVFVDKKDISNILSGENIFEEKSKNFNFSDQALMMSAFYKFSTLSVSNDSENYKNFSMDIFDMFLKYKEEIYDKSLEELIKIYLSFIIFYDYTKLQDVLSYTLDISDFINESLNENIYSKEKNIKDLSLISLLNSLLYESTGFERIKELNGKLNSSLMEVYNPETGLILKELDKKEISFSCDEIVFYILALILDLDLNPNEKEINSIITDVFKHQLINSGLILSCPNSPDLSSPERYRNFSLKTEDLLDEHDFRMESLGSLEASETAPVFLKNVVYNTKKSEFSKGKASFDSFKNMLIFFISIYMHNKLKKGTEKGEDV